MAATVVLLLAGGLTFGVMNRHSAPSKPPPPKAGGLDILPETPAVAPTTTTAPAPATTPSAPPDKPKEVVVYVTGAIRKPGVYTFHEGDRIVKAIQTAGGWKDGAVRESLNLADRLQDGDHLHIPTRAELERAAKPTFTPRPSAPKRVLQTKTATAKTGRILGTVPAASAPSASDPAAPDADAPKPAHGTKFKNPGDGSVDLNTASAEELQQVPGIGPSMAQKILDYRQQIGGFKSVEQMQDVKGVGEKTFAKMQPFLRVH